MKKKLLMILSWMVLPFSAHSENAFSPGAPAAPAPAAPGAPGAPPAPSPALASSVGENDCCNPYWKTSRLSVKTPQPWSIGTAP